MALPGGFSKLKGEKVGWKERDPVGYAQAQAELDAKKQEKLAVEAQEGGKDKGEKAKPRHKISDDGMQEQEGDDESPFAVPSSKPKSKEPAANKRPAPEVPPTLVPASCPARTTTTAFSLATRERGLPAEPARTARVGWRWTVHTLNQS